MTEQIINSVNMQTLGTNQSNVEDMFSVLYTSWGDYCISTTALKLYNERMSKLDSTYVPIDTENDEDMDRKIELESKRRDPVLIEIYNELGEKKFSDFESKIEIEKIPKKYENYYTIENYAGDWESVHVNVDKYNTDTIKNIIKNMDMDCGVKIEEIIKVLAENV